MRLSSIRDRLKKYLDNGGNNCPRCRSKNITNTDSIVMQSVECGDCASIWKNKYTLTSVTMDHVHEEKIK